MNPPPHSMMRQLLSHVDHLLGIQHVAPDLEESFLMEAAAVGHVVQVHGRRSGALPKTGETLPADVIQALARLIPQKTEVSVPLAPTVGLTSDREDIARSIAPLIPRRQISFCSGCSHRATYYALAQALENLGIDDPIVVGDIGCYTLGFYPPFNILQTMTSMGASMGTAAALAQLNPNRKVVAVIGDSTMYHAGMPGLLQISHLGLPVLVLVMDNSVTGSTGQQPHPGTWQQADHQTVVPIEDIAKAYRIRYVRVVGSFQLKRLSTILEEALTRDGPAVVVSRQACALEPSEIGRRIIVARIDQALCDGCMACVDEFGCPAFVPTKNGKNGSDKVDVELVLCNGCASCKFVCPQGAISFVRNEALRQ